ncbi:hypothetical protein TYRP_006093 [Tyrophagus putrescentiae]|nr:hypothetical protein TYRP_006093 [Tyrophagus putrescentiae]
MEMSHCPQQLKKVLQAAAVHTPEAVKLKVSSWRRLLTTYSTGPMKSADRQKMVPGLRKEMPRRRCTGWDGGGAENDGVDVEQHQVQEVDATGRPKGEQRREEGDRREGRLGDETEQRTGRGHQFAVVLAAQAELSHPRALVNQVAVVAGETGLNAAASI